MNGKALIILNPRSFLRIFSDYVCQKAEIFVSTLADSDVETFLEREENQIRNEKPKPTYLVALIVKFVAAKNEDQPLEDLPHADFGRVPE